MAIMIPCMVCKETGVVAPDACPTCNGDKEVEVLEGEFGLSGAHHITVLRTVVDIISKLDAVDVKLDALDAHLDIIETKIDAL